MADSPIEVYKRATTGLRARLTSAVGRKGHGSCGTEQPDLDLLNPKDLIDHQTGYWQDRNADNKPKRWLLKLDENAQQPAVVQAHPSPGDRLGGVNFNEERLVVVFRILLGVIPTGGSTYEYPGYEWLLVLGFQSPVPRAKSSTGMDDYDAINKQIEFKSRKLQISFVGLVTGDLATPAMGGNPTVSTPYKDATDLVAAFLSIPSQGSQTRVYDGNVSTELDQLISDLLAAVPTSIVSQPPSNVTNQTGLLGLPPSVYRQINAALKAGKRHLILYGPPGTGKTTVAEDVASQLSPPGIDVEVATASSAWTSNDLVGGYQPDGHGSIEFVPGLLVQKFDQPLVIDELNRAPIDRVLGPLFSILGDDATTLQYRAKPGVPGRDQFCRLLPPGGISTGKQDYVAGQFWRLIGTFNTIDKAQLSQISYALSRRFAWIKVDCPPNPHDVIYDYCQREGLFDANNPPSRSTNPIGDVWKAVNAERPLGAAPFLDVLWFLSALNPHYDFFAGPQKNSTDADDLIAAIETLVAPLLDGLEPGQGRDLADKIIAICKPSQAVEDSFKRTMIEKEA